MPGGRGMGGGGGMGRGSGRGSTGGGGGRNRGGAFGAGGFCICAGCGKKVAHQRGQKCTDLKCPDCGRTMVREELLESRRKPGDET
ncbi:hypothetical protein DRQ50_00975 [bacterium]|nr:MAG: hypothetical protein DRQ50_00975 [bacterium]RLE26198.1 MAG: hypothetical protein DRJ61_18565 [Acidobacteriota bacterium]